MYPLGFAARTGGRGQVPDRSVDERMPLGASAKPATLQEVAGFFTSDRRSSVQFSRHSRPYSEDSNFVESVWGFLTNVVREVRWMQMWRQ